MKYRRQYSKIRYATLRVTASDLAALGSAPLLLVPPPGANKAVILLDAVASVKLNGDAALDVGELQIGYVHADVDALLSSNLFASYTADTDVIHYVPSHALAGLLLDVVKVEDIGLYLHQVTASLIPGPILTHSLGAGGANYVVSDVLTVGDAEFTVLTVDGGGAILTYSLTDAGTTVEVGNGQAAMGGAGTGAKFDILTIDASGQNAEINIKVYYDIFNIDT